MSQSGFKQVQQSEVSLFNRCLCFCCCCCFVLLCNRVSCSQTGLRPAKQLRLDQNVQYSYFPFQVLRLQAIATMPNLFEIPFKDCMIEFSAIVSSLPSIASFKKYLLLVCLYDVSLWVHECHRTCVDVREQLCDTGWFFSSFVWFQEQNSGCQDYKASPFSAETSCSLSL